MTDPQSTGTEEQLTQGRHELLHQLESLMEGPLIVLGFVWLGLLVLEFVYGEGALFHTLGIVIWIIFVVDFVVKFSIAPEKGQFLRDNWLTAIALLAPALRTVRAVRFFRVFRMARVARTVRLLRVVSSMNRGMRMLSATMTKRGVVYVLALTSLVTFVGAAGMYVFEKESSGGLHTYSEALWWTAMIMTTMGSQFWPATVEGRILCVFLALYAFAVFGYVTAVLASYFIGHDAETAEAGLVGSNSIANLNLEVASLRREIRAHLAKGKGKR